LASRPLASGALASGALASGTITGRATPRPRAVTYTVALSGSLVTSGTRVSNGPSRVGEKRISTARMARVGISRRGSTHANGAVSMSVERRTASGAPPRLSTVTERVDWSPTVTSPNSMTDGRGAMSGRSKRTRCGSNTHGRAGVLMGTGTSTIGMSHRRPRSET
jgi:hypothetical protein